MDGYVLPHAALMHFMFVSHLRNDIRACVMGNGTSIFRFTVPNFWPHIFMFDAAFNRFVVVFYVPPILSPRRHTSSFRCASMCAAIVHIALWSHALLRFDAPPCCLLWRTHMYEQSYEKMGAAVRAPATRTRPLS